jgi:hypothetical protein
MSVRPEILRGILKKILFGPDGKIVFKNAKEVNFQFYTQNGHKYPFLGRLKRPSFENR